MVLQESLLLPVPGGLPDDHAALTEPLPAGLDRSGDVVAFECVGVPGVTRAFGELREPGHHVKIIVQP